jgi:hypothetical protein
MLIKAIFATRIDLSLSLCLLYYDDVSLAKSDTATPTPRVSWRLAITHPRLQDGCFRGQEFLIHTIKYMFEHFNHRVSKLVTMSNLITIQFNKYPIRSLDKFNVYVPPDCKIHGKIKASSLML